MTKNHAILLDGKALAEKIQSELKRKIQKLKTKPTLGIILVGSDPASERYVGIKKRDGERLGFDVIVHRLPKTTSQKTLTFAIKNLNRRKDVHGVIVQLPLPSSLNPLAAVDTIDPTKDVDGFHPLNIGRLTAGITTLAPATPSGIMRLLDHYRVPIAGKHAVIVGRSVTVGAPLAPMLLHRDATVTICHSKTKRLSDYTKTADILIVAVGKPKLIKGAMIKKGACVVDVGMNTPPNPPFEKGGKEKDAPPFNEGGGETKNLPPLNKGGMKGGWVGDVDFASAAKIAKWITPVPGGVGPMTVAMLFENTLTAARHTAH